MKTTPKAKKSLKTVETAITTVTKRIDKLPSQLKGARTTLSGLQTSGVKLLKKYPVRAAVGALAVGVAVAKIARNA